MVEVAGLPRLLTPAPSPALSRRGPRRRSRSRRPLGAGWLPLLVLLGTGCFTPEELRDRADRDALALIDARRDQLFTESGPFQLPVATRTFGVLERGEIPFTTREELLAGGLESIGPIDAVDALRIAAEDSEQVQREKESLYLSALDLTQERWRFGYRYGASGSASLAGDVGGTSTTASSSLGASVTRILGSGATIIADIGTSLFRFVSTGDGFDAASDVGLSITQPLLRGAGRFITFEPLRQTERNLVYAVRDFERFRRTFAVDVSDRVYRVLQSLDQLRNETLNFENLIKLRARNERLAEAGQLSEIQADQARQDELRSRNRLVSLQGNVERQLDAFNVFLGLPVGVEVTFESGILASLASDDSFLSGLTADVAVDFALDHRLDVMTTFDRVQDTVRREAIARDALRAGLGLSASADSDSDSGRPLGHSLEDTTWSVGLDVDLPVDLLPARNAWRQAEINLIDQQRRYERFLDDVTLSVRDALRRANNAYESLQIQRGAVVLSERRVRGADLSLQAGSASTRDLLEAQESLRQNRDAETSARIDFTLALLDLWLELEILRVDDDGVAVDSELSVELRDRIEAARLASQEPSSNTDADQAAAAGGVLTPRVPDSTESDSEDSARSDR